MQKLFTTEDPVRVLVLAGNSKERSTRRFIKVPKWEGVDDKAAVHVLGWPTVQLADKLPRRSVALARYQHYISFLTTHFQPHWPWEAELAYIRKASLNFLSRKFENLATNGSSLRVYRTSIYETTTVEHIWANLLQPLPSFLYRHNSTVPYRSAWCVRVDQSVHRVRVSLCVWTTTFEHNNLWSKYLSLKDTVYVKFDGQGHRSKFKVTRWQVPIWVQLSDWNK